MCPFFKVYDLDQHDQTFTSGKHLVKKTAVESAVTLRVYLKMKERETTLIKSTSLWFSPSNSSAYMNF